MNKPTNKTVIECYYTGCKYNNACCFSPYNINNEKCYCTRESIKIDIDLEEEINEEKNAHFGEFQCCNFEPGHKNHKCISCQMLENDGEIPLGDDLEFILVEDDDDFI